MAPAAFRLGYMTKIAELRKKAEGRYGKGIKDTIGIPLGTEFGPERTPEEYEAAGIKPLKPNRSPKRLDALVDRELDEGDAALARYESEGAEGGTARDTYMRELSDRGRAYDSEIASFVEGMDPAEREAYFARKAQTPEGTAAVGKDGKPIESYYASRARHAVTNAGDNVNLKTREQLAQEESAARAAKWDGNSTVKWTPKGTSTVQPGTSTSYVSTTPSTPEMRARNAVASGRATLKPAPMAGRPDVGDGTVAYNDAFPAVNTSAVDSTAVAGKPSLRVRYNARTGAYTRADGSTTPWTDKERAALEKYHAGQNRTTPINWNPTTVTQGFQQSFGKGSAGKDVTVARPVRRKQVASTTPVKPRNGV